jgi:selenium-binding protein 1
MRLLSSLARLGFVSVFGLALFAGCGNHGATDSSSSAATATDDAAARARRENVLYVWASDQAHVAPDFLAVINFDQDSPHYGRVIRTVPLPPPGSVGNEPHHMGLSHDKQRLGLGGLLSVLRGQPDVFFFDVSRSRHPVFITRQDPPNSAIADDFEDLTNGGFMVTMMGSATGGEPGRLAEFDANNNLVGEFPTNVPTDGHFNPHGLSIDEPNNLMVSSDFICPAHTLNIPGGDMAIFRGSVRVWDLAGRSIVKTIQVGDPNNPAGTIDVELVPNDPQLRAFATGMADGHLYEVDTQNGIATSVFDFESIRTPGTTAPTWPQLIRASADGKRLFVTVNYVGQAGQVAYFNIEDPDHPTLLDVADLGLGSGPHFPRVTADGKRLVVTDYFLVEDLAPGGIVQAEGDHKVHVINIHKDHLEIDQRFRTNFNTDIATGPARPHGLDFKHAPEGDGDDDGDD